MAGLQAAIHRAGFGLPCAGTAKLNRTIAWRRVASEDRSCLDGAERLDRPALGASKEAHMTHLRKRMLEELQRVFSLRGLTRLVCGNWDAGIRTPISRSRVCGPTVGRRPNKGYNSTTWKNLPHAKSVCCDICGDTASKPFFVNCGSIAMAS